jgi:glycosyltransferase XagB
MAVNRKTATAEQFLSLGQTAIAGMLLVLVVAFGVVFGLLAVLQGIVALVIAFYVVFVGFQLLLRWAANLPPMASGSPLPTVEDQDLPSYTILVPLHREGRAFERLVRSLERLRYPVAKLEVLLLLEKDDEETIRVAMESELPEYFYILIVPDAGPRTKPKACNYGYMRAAGELMVIFDAEDRTEPDQLLAAVAGFRAAANHCPRPVGCLQAELSFWNPRHGWVSTFYWAEYVTHFRRTLQGLARLRLIPPLGGTSNHFVREALDRVAKMNGAWHFRTPEGHDIDIGGPWDPFNVTEDADLAFRLALAGYETDVLPEATTYSTTYEEAPDKLCKAKNQRSRWLQGYWQTGLVHTRQPLSKMKQVGVRRFLAFNLFMLGTPFALLVNPIMWGTTLFYVVARLCSFAGAATLIQSLFPAPIYYAGMLVAIVGNFVLFYQNLVTPISRQQRSEGLASIDGQHELATYQQKQEYGLVARLLLTPTWWAFTSISAYRALRKLLIPSQRSAWDKTDHGHAAALEAMLESHAINPRHVSPQDVDGAR